MLCQFVTLGKNYIFLNKNNWNIINQNKNVPVEI